MLNPNGGNVGIGTMSPTAPLEVYNPNNSQVALFQSGNADAWIALQPASGSLWRVQAQTTGNFTIYDQTNSASRLSINSSGNVGIGATSPVSSLDLSQKNDALALPGGSNAQRPTGGSLVNGEIRYNNTGSGSIEAYYNSTWNTLGGGGGTPAGSNGQVQFNNAGAFGASSSFYWDNTNGRLGIGTTAPAAPLSVAGEVQVGSSGLSCSSATAGSLRWTGHYLWGCDGNYWLVAMIGNTAISPYSVGTSPMGVAYDSGTPAIWVANSGSSNVSKINPSTGAVIGTYSVGTSPIGVAYDSGTPAIWVANGSSSNVSKINPSTGAVIGTTSVGTSPYGVAYDSGTPAIWVANSGSSNVTELNPSTGAVIGTYSVGTAPFGVAYDSSTPAIWVTNEGSNNVTKLNPSSGATIGTFAVALTPYYFSVAYDSGTSAIWVTNYSSNKVTKILMQ
jgi:YVTN family beta-propeller protein